MAARLDGARPFVLVLMVVAVATVLLVGAGRSAGAASPESLVALCVAALACALANAFPVTVRRVSGGRVVDAGRLSVGVVFVTSCAVVVGPAAACLAGAGGALAAGLARRRQPVKVVYTAAVYGIGGVAAGLASRLVEVGDPALSLPLQVVAGVVAFYAVNESLITAAIALTAREPVGAAIRDAAAASLPLFAIMSSVAFVLVVLWQRHPLYAVALAGPAAAVLLHQRSTSSALMATHLAATDALTGLGNVRLFDDRFAFHVAEAQRQSSPLAVCLIDLDDFKAVNDGLGHEAGDRALVAVATAVASEGEAFRLGGDEFALLLPGHDDSAARAVAERIIVRSAEATRAAAVPAHVSVGVASWPAVADPGLLRAAADRALYAAKAEGKATARTAGVRGAPRAGFGLAA